MAENKTESRKVCGIIMPISNMKVGELTYPEEYWRGVLAFLIDAINHAGFNPIVAWENDKSDVIHSKIINNIESLPLMVGVLVGNNPNVWLECGMRLWKRKPLLLLVSDKAKKIPFDISPIECLRFPEDCHYDKLKVLKGEIKKRLQNMAREDYRPILSYFADVKLSEDDPVVRKVELEAFISETKESIRKLESRLDTYEIGNCKSSRSAYEGGYGVVMPEHNPNSVQFGGSYPNQYCFPNLSGSSGPSGPIGPTGSSCSSYM